MSLPIGAKANGSSWSFWTGLLSWQWCSSSTVQVEEGLDLTPRGARSPKPQAQPEGSPPHQAWLLNSQARHQGEQTKGISSTPLDEAPQMSQEGPNIDFNNNKDKDHDSVKNNSQDGNSSSTGSGNETDNESDTNGSPDNNSKNLDSRQSEDSTLEHGNNANGSLESHDNSNDNTNDNNDNNNDNNSNGNNVNNDDAEHNQLVQQLSEPNINRSSNRADALMDVYLYKYDFIAFWHYMIAFDTVMLDYGRFPRLGTKLAGTGIEVYDMGQLKEPEEKILLGRVPLKTIVKAVWTLSKNGEWTYWHYAVGNHNCQDFAVALAGLCGLQIEGDNYLKAKRTWQAWFGQSEQNKAPALGPAPPVNTGPGLSSPRQALGRASTSPRSSASSMTPPPAPHFPRESGNFLGRRGSLQNVMLASASQRQQMQQQGARLRQ